MFQGPVDNEGLKLIMQEDNCYVDFKKAVNEFDKLKVLNCWPVPTNTFADDATKKFEGHKVFPMCSGK